MSDIMRLWKEGLSTAEIAECLALDEHVVYNRLARMRGHLIYRPEAWQTKRKAYVQKLREANIPIHEREIAVRKFMDDLVKHAAH
jgi:transposase